MGYYIRAQKTASGKMGSLFSPKDSWGVGFQEHQTREYGFSDEACLGSSLKSISAISEGAHWQIWS